MPPSARQILRNRKLPVVRLNTHSRPAPALSQPALAYKLEFAPAAAVPADLVVHRAAAHALCIHLCRARARARARSRTDLRTARGAHAAVIYISRFSCWERPTPFASPSACAVLCCSVYRKLALNGFCGWVIRLYVVYIVHWGSLEL